MQYVGTEHLPIRIGVFSNVANAEQAVHNLLADGFTVPQITVICSDKIREAHFKAYEHQDPSGAHAPEAAATGGAIGVAIGGLTAAAVTLATGGAAFLISGALGAWTGGVVGGLVGAMMTRGVEHELADYYDQAVTRGRILVAAEATGPGGPEKLKQAESALAAAGAEPFPLAES